MSFTTLVFINGNTISIIHDHYERILEFLNTPQEREGFNLDAGYLIADSNTKTITSNQSAFHKNHLKNRWTWINQEL